MSIQSVFFAYVVRWEKYNVMFLSFEGAVFSDYDLPEMIIFATRNGVHKFCVRPIICNVVSPPTNRSVGLLFFSFFWNCVPSILP